jgi:hypothetical protein
VTGTYASVDELLGAARTGIERLTPLDPGRTIAWPTAR